MTVSNIPVVQLPNDMEEFLCDMLGAGTNPSRYDSRALITSAAVCRAWNLDLIFKLVRKEIGQHAKLKGLIVHIKDLDLLIRKAGHTFRRVPVDLRNAATAERRLSHVAASADWTTIEANLYRSKLKNRLFGGIESCRKSIKKKRIVSRNTILFFLIDLRRFEPAQKPILEFTSV